MLLDLRWVQISKKCYGKWHLDGKILCSVLLEKEFKFGCYQIKPDKWTGVHGHLLVSWLFILLTECRTTLFCFDRNFKKKEVLVVTKGTLIMSIKYYWLQWIKE